MSLGIQVTEVEAVLLTTGEWVPVQRGTFDIDSYEYLDGDERVHGGGQAGGSANGFRFHTPEGHEINGPLTAIVAVRRIRDTTAEAIGNIK